MIPGLLYADAASYLSSTRLKAKIVQQQKRAAFGSSSASSARGPVSRPPAAPPSVVFPEPGEQVDNSDFVKYHDGAKTCYIHGVDASVVSLNAAGPFVSLGPPMEDMNGIQVFGGPAAPDGRRQHQASSMAALLLHIPARANPLGNFDRWAIFSSIARPKESCGKAAHEQILETTARSNGTEWRYVVDHGTKQKFRRRKGLVKQKYPHESIVLPQGLPYCVEGHDVAVNVMSPLPSVALSISPCTKCCYDCDSSVPRQPCSSCVADISRQQTVSGSCKRSRLACSHKKSKGSCASSAADSLLPVWFLKKDVVRPYFCHVA